MSQETDEELRSEADQLLAFGLRTILNDYGEVNIIGSYDLHLMVWRDLDIHLVQPALDKKKFFELGGRIAGLLKPHRMHYRDETEVGTEGLPRGLYWGVYLGDERAGAWNISGQRDRMASKQLAPMASESENDSLTPLAL